jgi:hypothetical protein
VGSVGIYIGECSNKSSEKGSRFELVDDDFSIATDDSVKRTLAFDDKRQIV